MPRYLKSGPTVTARGTQQIEDLFRIMQKRYTTQMLYKVKQAWLDTIEDIVENSPVYTGASAGVPGAPHSYRTGYRSHPAFGKKIGNVFNGGESGWQIGERKINQYRTQFYIFNPMWEHYLKFVEYNQAPNQKHPGRFVRNAIERLKQRIKSGDI